MNLLKLLTKSGRQEIVSTELKSYLTPDRVAALVADGVSRALEAGADKLTDKRVAQISDGCTKGANALIHLTAAVAPDGEEGKKVSEGEKALIATDVKTALGELLTQTAIDSVIDKFKAYIP